MRNGVRLGIDVGTVRIGVARSDPSGLLATPVETVRRGKGDLSRIAALARELPDFVTGLVSIAQRGRSLGLHLVLATQRPTGVVSPGCTGAPSSAASSAPGVPAASRGEKFHEVGATIW